MIVEGREYLIVTGSDLERDGMFLELYVVDRANGPIAECFRSDADGSLTLTEHVAGIPTASLTQLRVRRH